MLPGLSIQIYEMAISALPSLAVLGWYLRPGAQQLLSLPLSFYNPYLILR